MDFTDEVGIREGIWIEVYRYKLRKERSVAARKKEEEDKGGDQPITLPDLPGDLVESEIISRLPARSLSRFRCVCKLWRSRLGDPAFLKTTRYVRHKAVIQSLSDRFYSIDYEASDWNAVPLDFPYQELRGHPRDFENVRLIGSHNGWVCVDIGRNSSDSAILVWNPLTGEYKNIPDSSPKFYQRQIGFGYDSCADDYFVVRMCAKHKRRPTSVGVYKLKTNSWEEIEVVVPAGLADKKHSDLCDAVVNGSVVYLLVDADINGVVSFDLKDGKFRDVPLPDDIRTTEDQIGLDVLEGCLVVVEWSREKPQGRVWQLKQESSDTTPMKQVWVKHSKLTIASTFNGPFRFAQNGRVVGFARFDRSKNRYDLVVCDGNEKKTAPIVGPMSRVVDMWTYVENPASLVIPTENIELTKNAFTFENYR
ncbi:hypothetical protein RJ639_043245 [Escallonia herrerae]|uniref:F-box domain-containing protein n=1 Tax=Escallonia herrerae TaxID=1293975 RepID=A0AA89B279_9ASTE|nr:hypothetical protein RJ639_043245 [Escallonia herrerae]